MVLLPGSRVKVSGFICEWVNDFKLKLIDVVAAKVASVINGRAVMAVRGSRRLWGLSMSWSDNHMLLHRANKGDLLSQPLGMKCLPLVSCP